MTVQTDMPTFDTAHLGAVEVSVTGLDLECYPQRTVLLYPAVYELRGRESTSVDSPEYRPNPALRKVVLDKTTEYVNACVAAGAAMARTAHCSCVCTPTVPRN